MTPPADPREKRKDFSRTDWRRQDIERISVTSGAKNARELAVRHDVLTTLYDNGQHDVLRRVKAGEITMRQLMAAKSRGALLRADLAADLKLRAPLWETLEAQLPTMGKSAATRASYRTQARSILRRGILGEKAIVADLLTVDWAAHRAKYESPAGWNHVRRTFSALLSRLLGDRFHPSVRAFRQAFGTMEKEHDRVVTVSAAQLGRLVRALPDWMQPAAITMIGTGIRLGEATGQGSRAPRYDAETGILHVHGKTGPRVVEVPANVRPWAAVAFPTLVRRRAFYQRIKDAAAAAGIPTLRVHDLRHAAATTALAGGAPINAVQDLLGHADLATTARYTRAANAAAAGRAVGKQLTKTLGTLGTAPTRRTPLPARSKQARAAGAAGRTATRVQPSTESSTTSRAGTSRKGAQSRGAHVRKR